VRRREGEREGRREGGGGKVHLLSSPFSVSTDSFASKIVTWHTSYDHTKRKFTLMNGSRLSFISTTADQFKAQFRIQYI
jgi:hypothetical protein